MSKYSLVCLAHSHWLSVCWCGRRCITQDDDRVKWMQQVTIIVLFTLPMKSIVQHCPTFSLAITCDFVLMLSLYWFHIMCCYFVSPLLYVCIYCSLFLFSHTQRVLAEFVRVLSLGCQFIWCWNIHVHILYLWIYLPCLWHYSDCIWWTRYKAVPKKERQMPESRPINHDEMRRFERCSSWNVMRYFLKSVTVH